MSVGQLDVELRLRTGLITLRIEIGTYVGIVDAIAKYCLVILGLIVSLLSLSM